MLNGKVEIDLRSANELSVSKQNLDRFEVVLMKNKKTLFVPDQFSVTFSNVNEVIIMHNQYSLRDSYSVTLFLFPSECMKTRTYILL